MKRLQASLALAIAAVAVSRADLPQPAMDHVTRLQPAAYAVQPLFHAAPAARDPDGARTDVIRKRTVQIDRAAFKTIDPDADSRFVLNLFDDATYEAVISHSVVRGPRSFTCFGKLVGLGLADFMLVVEDDVVLLRVGDYENRRSFELRSVGDETAFVYELSNFRADECGEPLLPEPPAGDGPAPRGNHRCGGATIAPEDVGDRFDILVVYTLYARDAQGGDAAMRALAFQAMDDMNQRLSNSNRYQRVRVVAALPINYGESGVGETDLEMLKGTTDPYMNEVHTWRADVRADLVVLIVDTLDVGGIAPRSLGTDGTPPCSKGFAVVRRTAIGGGTFAHELGHTFGNCHSAEEGGCSNPINAYCRGYRFTCGAVRWHTTLASDAHDPSSRRIPYYSTPAVLFDCDPNGGGADEAIGSDTANAGQTIEDFSNAVANNYHGDFICYVNGVASDAQIGSAQFPYHSIRTAFDERRAGTTVNISAGVYNERGLYSTPMKLTAYDGNVLIH